MIYEKTFLITFFHHLGCMLAHQRHPQAQIFLTQNFPLPSPNLQQQCSSPTCRSSCHPYTSKRHCPQCSPHHALEWHIGRGSPLYHQRSFRLQGVQTRRVERGICIHNQDQLQLEATPRLDGGQHSGVAVWPRGTLHLLWVFS